MSDELRPRRRWPTALLALLVFVSGSVVGGGTAAVVIGHRLQTPEDELDELVADQLERELDLSPEERRQMRPLLNRRQARLRAIADEVDTRWNQELDSLASEIGGNLRPDKARRLEQRLKDLRQRLRQPRGR